MKYINKFDSINESKGSAIREIKAWSAVVKAEIKSIMLSNLKPGTDRGSSQAVIDVRDIVEKPKVTLQFRRIYQVLLS